MGIARGVKSVANTTMMEAVLLLISGASGAGKSTVRQAIASDLEPAVSAVELRLCHLPRYFETVIGAGMSGWTDCRGSQPGGPKTKPSRSRQRPATRTSLAIATYSWVWSFQML